MDLRRARNGTRAPAGAAGRADGNDRGAALVEFALIAPVLFSLLLGTVTGGLALATKSSMTNAVREAGRLGATMPEGSSWDTWATLVRDRAVELSGGDLTTGRVCVEIVQWNGSASPPSETVLGRWPATSCGITGEPAVPASTADGACVVKVWAERSAEVNALFFQRTVDLRASAVGRYERAECP
jgi:hypothetical protein